VILIKKLRSEKLSFVWKNEKNIAISGENFKQNGNSVKTVQFLMNISNKAEIVQKYPNFWGKIYKKK